MGYLYQFRYTYAVYGTLGEGIFIGMASCRFYFFFCGAISQKDYKLFSVMQVEIISPKKYGLPLGSVKPITGKIGSIRKLTSDYFDDYGSDVKKDAVAIGGGSLSGDGLRWL